MGAEGDIAPSLSLRNIFLGDLLGGTEIYGGGMISLWATFSFHSIISIDQVIW